MFSGQGPYRTGILRAMMREPKLALFIMRRYLNHDAKAERRRANEVARWKAEKRREMFLTIVAAVVGVLLVASGVMAGISMVFAANLDVFGLVGALFAVLELVLGIGSIAALVWAAVVGPDYVSSKNRKLREWAEKEVNKWESQ
ncbi:MAG: hypothetical protein DRI24_17030 [Deltaproteobacteria bacterium]|nr:MAG: hypothetical protein DRI24_17030 [Deltaproteobacteria bacterium]